MMKRDCVANDAVQKLDSLDSSIREETLQQIINGVIGSNRQKLLYLRLGIGPRIVKLAMVKEEGEDSSEQARYLSAILLGSLSLGSLENAFMMEEAGAIGALLHLLGDQNQKIFEAAARSLRYFFDHPASLLKWKISSSVFEGLQQSLKVAQSTATKTNSALLLSCFCDPLRYSLQPSAQNLQDFLAWSETNKGEFQKCPQLMTLLCCLLQEGPPTVREAVLSVFDSLSGGIFPIASKIMMSSEDLQGARSSSKESEKEMERDDFFDILELSDELFSVLSDKRGRGKGGQKSITKSLKFLRQVGEDILPKEALDLTYESLTDPSCSCRILASSVIANLLIKKGTIHASKRKREQVEYDDGSPFVTFLTEMSQAILLNAVNDPKEKIGVKESAIKVFMKLVLLTRFPFLSSFIPSFVEMIEESSEGPIQTLLYQALSSLPSPGADWQWPPSIFKSIKRDLNSESQQMKFAVCRFCRFLSRCSRSIRAELLPLLPKSAINQKNEQITILSSAVIANLILGNHSSHQILRKEENVECIKMLLQTEKNQCCKMGLWILKNLTFYSEFSIRSSVCKIIPLAQLLKFVCKEGDLSLQEQALGLLRNLVFEGSSLFDSLFEENIILKDKLIKILCQKAQQQNPLGIYLNALYAISNLCSSGNWPAIQEQFIQAGVLEILLEAITHFDPQVKTATLWCLINCCWKGSSEIQKKISQHQLFVKIQELKSENDLDTRDRVITLLDLLSAQEMTLD